MPSNNRLSAADALYIDRLRGFSILRVVLVHLGLGWIFPPWSEFIHAFMPILFFVSGAVSYFSLKRAASVGTFLTKRTLALTLPFYLIAVLAFSLLYLFSPAPPAMGLEEMLRWLSLSPAPETMPYRINQVWFLHSLLIITFAVVPVLLLARRREWVWYPAMALPLLVSVGQCLYPIDDLLMWGGHNFYQPLANAGFFLFGAFFYEKRSALGPRFLLGLFWSAATAVVAYALLTDGPIGLAAHSYAPNFYYVAASFAALALALLLQGPVSALLDRAVILDGVLLFFSKHAFSIFLLHSYFIEAAERYLGLVDVAADPLRAAAKIAVVITASAVAAIPLSAASNALRNGVQQRVVRVPAAPRIGAG